MKYVAKFRFLGKLSNTIFFFVFGGYFLAIRVPDD